MCQRAANAKAIWIFHTIFSSRLCKRERKRERKAVRGQCVVAGRAGLTKSLLVFWLTLAVVIDSRKTSRQKAADTFVCVQVSDTVSLCVCVCVCLFVCVSLCVRACVCKRQIIIRMRQSFAILSAALAALFSSPPTLRVFLGYCCHQLKRKSALNKAQKHRCITFNGPKSLQIKSTLKDSLKFVSQKSWNRNGIHLVIGRYI